MNSSLLEHYERTAWHSTNLLEALTILNMFEYDSEGHIKRWPSEQEYTKAINKIVDVKNNDNTEK
jgi:hypothetical protein